MAVKILVALTLALFPWVAYATAEPVKGIYYGSYIFGNKKIISNIEELLAEKLLNTIVIDKKDDHGTEITGEHFQKLIKPFKDRDALIMCRIVVLKDNRYAQGAGKKFALKKISKPDELWTDKNGSTYLDPAVPEVADYLIEISVRAIKDGCFPNFDYIRLPSPRDGNTRDTKYPPTRSMKEIIKLAKTAEERKGLIEENEQRNLIKRQAMQGFLNRLVSGIREKFPNSPLAVSLFGYACYGEEPGVGQYLDDFARLGLIISCMAYPGHYSCNDTAPDPSKNPYGIYYKTHEMAQEYLKKRGLTAVFLPWVQGFDRRTNEGCGLGKDKNGKVVGITGKRGDFVLYASDPVHFRKQIKGAKARGVYGYLVWGSRAAFENKALYRED